MMAIALWGPQLRSKLSDSPELPLEFCFNATNHIERYLESNEEVVRKLLCSTYVHDIVTGADFKEAAFTVYIQAKDMF